MVRVELPELAVHDVEVLVTEEAQHLVDVVLVIQVLQRVQQLPHPQLAQADLPCDAADEDGMFDNNQRAGAKQLWRPRTDRRASGPHDAQPRDIRIPTPTHRCPTG